MTNKVGRPTDYDLALCEEVIELGRKGYTRAQMASHLNIARATLYLWADAHPEFMDALSRARDHAQAYWEHYGQNHMLTKDGVSLNAGVYNKMMSAAFPDDYTEKRVLAGDSEAPVRIEAVAFEIVDT